MLWKGDAGMNRKELEEQLAQTLEEGELVKPDAGETARRKLPHKTEIRIQTPHDPIREETRQYRRMAQEIDGRYDKYGSNEPNGDGPASETQK